LQGILLDWLYEFHAYLDDPAALRQLYGMVFRLLDDVTLRVPAARLLCLITAMSDVTSHRCRHVCCAHSLAVRPAE
jgi:hypothetical protein